MPEAEQNNGMSYRNKNSGSGGSDFFSLGAPVTVGDPITEPSHSRCAPEVPEPLTIGAQYLTRYNTWKNFVRATRPVLVCASPKTNIHETFSS